MLSRLIIDNSTAYSTMTIIARHIGFIHKGGKGSHCAFGRHGEAKLLNFQNKKGYIPVYQAKQLLEMLKKYEKK